MYGCGQIIIKVLKKLNQEIKLGFIGFFTILFLFNMCFAKELPEIYMDKQVNECLIAYVTSLNNGLIIIKSKQKYIWPYYDSIEYGYDGIDKIPNSKPFMNFIKIMKLKSDNKIKVKRYYRDEKIIKIFYNDESIIQWEYYRLGAKVSIYNN